MDPSINIKTVLIPVDFSDTSRKAFYTGLKFARLFEAETVVLHVKEPITSVDSSFDKVEKHTEELERMEKGVRRRVNELFEAGGFAEVDRRKVRTTVRAGKPHMQIVQYALEHNIDLIVMGTHGYTGMKAILVGSVTERVVRYAPCPVLCVKPEDYKSPLEGSDFK